MIRWVFDEVERRYTKEIDVFAGLQMIIVCGVALIIALAAGLAPFVAGAYIALRLMKMGC